MKTFNQWLVDSIVEYLDDLARNMRAFTGKQRIKSDNSKLKFIPNWLVWVITIIIIVLYWAVVFSLLAGL